MPRRPRRGQTLMLDELRSNAQDVTSGTPAGQLGFTIYPDTIPRSMNYRRFFTGRVSASNLR